MNKQLLLSEFLTTPWALMPERLQAIAGVLSRWQAGDLPSEETLLKVNADRLIRESRKQFASANAGAGIAVLPLYGVVTQRGNMVDDISGPGSTSTQQFAAALRQRAPQFILCCLRFPTRAVDFGQQAALVCGRALRFAPALFLLDV